MLLAAGALLLAMLYVTPLWRVDLFAPQYPEGLGMLISVHRIDGVKDTDLGNINALNHYIGMRPIDAAAIPEMRVMPWVLAGLIVLAMGAAVTARRRLATFWVAMLAIAGAAGMLDFWRWGYQYGHALDPNAIIVVPGMSYQPPLIGSKQLLNFTAHSWPAIGTLFASLAFVCGVVALVERKDASIPRRVRDDERAPLGVVA